MALDELATAPEISRFLEAIQRSRRHPLLKLHWEAGRIEVLRGKVASPNIAVFEKSCARGQLAAADGDIGAAENELLTTLQEFRRLYPHNGHLFQHILQLALAIQALDLVSLFLNDRHGTPDLFIVTFEESKNDPAINWVSVDDAGRCHFAVDPRIPGKHHADYFVAHWVSSAPLWASYCRSAEWEPGRAPMNSGEAGVISGLAYCGNKPEFFLVPDGYFLGTRGYADLHAKYDAARLKWEDRQPIAFWRGGNTGVRTGRMDWRSLPRIRLCQISQENKDVLDAALSGVVQTAGENERLEIEATGLVKGRVPVEAFLDFKYQIDIDGNTNAWPGLYQRLLSGSPVLKVASPHGFRQWYYERLKPWRNYVPVASDMSDLIEKIEWLRDNDDQARAIGEAGQALANSLDYDRELTLAHDRIRAAFRWLQGRPETEVYFGSDRQGNEGLAQGWDLPECDRVSALGSHSLISVKRPASTGEYEFILEIEPHTHPPEVPAQRVVISIDDDVVVETMLEERRNVSWILRDDIFGQRDTLWVLIQHPDGFAPSRYGSDDDRPRSIAVRSFSIVKGPTPSAAVTESAASIVANPEVEVPAERTIVYDDDELRVMWQPGTSDYLLMTFGNMTTLANGDRIYADEPVKKLGLNCIGFMAKTRNWYPAENMRAAVQAIDSLLARFPIKIAYGGSMGGYAAIKFSALLGVSETIAFCPQWSIDPNECGDTRSGYGTEFRPFMTGMGIRSEDIAGRSWVLYDPSNQTDSFHYGKIASLDGYVVPVHIHMVDHHVAGILAGTSILSQIIDACRNDNPGSLYQITSRVRRDHRIRRSILLRKAASRHPILVLRALNALAAAGHQDFKDDDVFYLAIIESLITRGEKTFAASTIERLSSTVCPQRLRLLQDLIDRSISEEGLFDKDNIITFHDTTLVYNVFDGKLRHLPLGPLHALPVGQYPVSLTDVDQQKVLTLRRGEEVFGCAVQEDGRIRLLNMLALDQEPIITAEQYPDFFALRIRGRYVCADRADRMAYDRLAVQAWEKFTKSGDD